MRIWQVEELRQVGMRGGAITSNGPQVGVIERDRAAATAAISDLGRRA